jgi:ribosomal protein S18 acetylase RimI-like enzyme
MPDAILIREARPDDWPVIAEFNCRLALETENKRLDPATIENGVRTLIQEPARGRYFLAVINDCVVGQLMHTREWSDWRNGDIWWLQSVYVAAEFRRRGVFRRLYQHLQTLAESDPRVVGIRLYVEHGNARAQETYRSLGLTGGGYEVMEQMFVSIPLAAGESAGSGEPGRR